MKEIFLYYPVYDFVIQNILEQMNEAEGSEVRLRVNTPGGNILACMGLYQQIKQTGCDVKIDGCAMSAGAFLPFYAKHAECLDVTKFLFHRADMYVSDEDDQKLLDDVNADLKKQMKKVIDLKLWKEITGITIEQLFDPTQRREVTISGDDAKRLGIVDKVTKLTPERQKEIAAFSNHYRIAAKADPITTTMTLAELKAKHPEVFAQAVKIGVTKERNRVSAYLPFVGIAPKTVKAGIAGGKRMTDGERSELALKVTAKKVAALVKSENAGDVTTTAEATEKGKKLTPEAQKKADSMKEFEDAINERVGLKK